MKTNDDLFFALPVDPRLEAHEMILEALVRLLIWMADAPTGEERGVRSSVALYCRKRAGVMRPDQLYEFG